MSLFRKVCGDQLMKGPLYQPMQGFEMYSGPTGPQQRRKNHCKINEMNKWIYMVVALKLESLSFCDIFNLMILWINQKFLLIYFPGLFLQPCNHFVDIIESHQLDLHIFFTYYIPNLSHYTGKLCIFVSLPLK